MFDIENYTVYEDEGEICAYLVLSKIPNREITVDISVTDGTATGELYIYVLFTIFSYICHTKWNCEQII